MTKPIYKDLLLLLILALLIRGLAALPQQQPNYMDAAYSYVNALNLQAGRGFVEDFVWIYLNDPHPPPQPSHLYWMPLTSIGAWLGMMVGGASYRAAQIPFIFLSALLAPITYLITYILGNQRRQSWLAGLLIIFSGFYFPFWTAIDNFTPFAVAGSLALFLGWLGFNCRVKTQAALYLFAAGLCAGLAHLARADGLLVPVVLILACWLHLIFSKQFALRSVIYITLFLIFGYLLIMTPWFIRNRLVVGTPLPTAGSQTIWLTGYNDLFSYGRELSAQTFLAQGWVSILQGRWWALITNLQTVLAVWGLVLFLPLALVGCWYLRRHLLIRLAGLYAILLFVAMTLVFAFPGARGGLFHSGAAVLPFIYATAVIGLDTSVDWLAARRRNWQPQFAKQIFGISLVVLAVVVSSFVYYRRVIKDNVWNHADPLYPAVVTWVAAQNPAATVMINNPPAYRYHGGGLSVVVPNEDIEITLQAARRYHVDYLVLDQNHPAPLANLYHQTDTHPQLTLVKTIGDIYIFELSAP